MLRLFEPRVVAYPLQTLVRLSSVREVLEALHCFELCLNKVADACDT